MTAKIGPKKDFDVFLGGLAVSGGIALLGLVTGGWSWLAAAGIYGGGGVVSAVVAECAEKCNTKFEKFTENVKTEYKEIKENIPKKIEDITKKVEKKVEKLEEKVERAVTKVEEGAIRTVNKVSKVFSCALTTGTCMAAFGVCMGVQKFCCEQEDSFICTAATPGASYAFLAGALTCVGNGVYETITKPLQNQEDSLLSSLVGG